jgi:hypothetical protein
MVMSVNCDGMAGCLVAFIAGLGDTLFVIRLGVDRWTFGDS